MKRNLLVFALLALAGSARADVDVRKVDAFSGIDLAGVMVVKATIGPSKVEVHGDADLLKLVSTTVQNGVLVVDTPRDFMKSMKGRKDGKLEVIVSAPDLSRVSISGTGTIDVAGLASRSLSASIAGTGALRLAGKTDKLKLVVDGAGEVKAKNLVANDVDVEIPGTAEAHVHAAKSLDADVPGTAVVRVYGKPANVKKSVHGTAIIDVK